MQKQMEEAQAELEEAVYTATAGGGAVEVTISGKKEITSIKFEPEVVDPDDIGQISWSVKVQHVLQYFTLLLAFTIAFAKSCTCSLGISSI